jgi:4-hydroxy-tetrahydrodipicolinate synthase
LPFLVAVLKVSVALNAIRRGSVVALVTPMKLDGSIDHSRLRELLSWHVKEGTDGAIVLGTTGEASTISFEERRDVIQTALSEVKNAFPIIVGTGAIDPSSTISMTKQAFELGADASLIITPQYVKPPQRALIQHYTQVAQAVPNLPMILYNCPGRTGVDMKPTTIGEIFKRNPKTIIGVKDATGDLSRISELRQFTSPEFFLFTGEDDSGCEFIQKGGDGVMSVTANIAPKLMHQMTNWAKQSDKVSAAQEINQKLMPLHKRYVNRLVKVTSTHTIIGTQEDRLSSNYIEKPFLRFIIDYYCYYYYRLFLESNPIPAKKALEIMKKIGKQHSIILYSILYGLLSIQFCCILYIIYRWRYSSTISTIR